MDRKIFVVYILSTNLFDEPPVPGGQQTTHDPQYLGTKELDQRLAHGRRAVYTQKVYAGGDDDDDDNNSISPKNGSASA